MTSTVRIQAEAVTPGAGGPGEMEAKVTGRNPQAAAGELGVASTCGC